MTAADGAVLGVTRVLDHGPAAQRWNVVVLGDGYRAAELPKFHDDVTQFVNYLYGVTPFNELWTAINIFRVDITSTDSGADDPLACGGTGATAATYLDATFCFNGVTKRLLAGDSVRARAVALAAVPEVHLTLVIVNTATYGGAGGSAAWFSTAPEAAEIAIHELGHTFFGLEDEYADAMNVYAGPSPPSRMSPRTSIAPQRSGMSSSTPPHRSRP